MTWARGGRVSAAGRITAAEGQRDALLDVLAAILLAYGEGDDRRLAVSSKYVGELRREIVVDPARDGRIVVRFAQEGGSK